MKINTKILMLLMILAVIFSGMSAENVECQSMFRKNYDFDGDTKADITVYRSSTGPWYGLLSSNNHYWIGSGASVTNKMTPGDFDGDGRAEPKIFTAGVFIGINLATNTFDTPVLLGEVSDFPVAGDFDGNGKSDYCVFRPDTGDWYWKNTQTNVVTMIHFGAIGDKPVMADFDGDGKSDIAVYRPGNGTWYWLRSSDGAFGAVNFGIVTDKPVPADYDGDGKTDIAVYREGNWYILKSSDSSFLAISFGATSPFPALRDIPAPTDYDGDGTDDFAVFRPSEGVWYLMQSTAGFAAATFGTNGDIPAPAAFIR